MRMVVLSYSHHGRSMARTAHALGHEIVGVMDGEKAPRQQLAEDFQCPGFATASECLDASKPDAALVAGKHIEMPSHVQACVDLRIPYLLDKPFADCADRLRPAAEAYAAFDHLLQGAIDRGIQINGERRDLSQVGHAIPCRVIRAHALRKLLPRAKVGGAAIERKCA